MTIDFMNKRHRLLNIGAYTLPEKYNSAKFKRSEDYLFLPSIMARATNEFVFCASQEAIYLHVNSVFLQ